jgi:Fe2+ transport system protein FeoA
LEIAMSVIVERRNSMSQNQPGPTLADLQPGQSGVVAALQSTGLERRRMMDLGIVPGTLVRVEMRSPLGDPVAYRVRGAVVALRLVQARQIQIEQLPPDERE